MDKKNVHSIKDKLTKNDILTVGLRVEKHIDVKGREGDKISEVISDVIREFVQRDNIMGLKKIKVFITKKPVETCQKIIFSDVKLRRHGEMREWICQNIPSLSYWKKGKVPVIMIDAHGYIFDKKDYEAFKGLFAHELMHLLNKIDGIERELESEAEGAMKNILYILSKHKEVKPFTRDRLLVSLIRVTSTGMLIIKDILANTRAMSFGFDGELYANYRATLFDAKSKIEFTDDIILKALKKDKKHVLDDAFLAYLGLNMTWVTFKMFHNQWYKKLEERSDIKVPRIIKRNADPVLKELLKLRSASDKTHIRKILKLMQLNYYNVVRHYCKKLR